MKGRSKFVISVVALLLLVLGVLVVAGRREPSYQAKSLSYWVMKASERNTNAWMVGQMPQYDVSPEIDAAIRSIGTNGIPFYLEWLPYQPSRSMRMQMSLATFLRRFIAHDWHPYLKTQKRRSGALVAFSILKESAAPAIPQLVFCATNESNSSNIVNQIVSIQCLCMIGTPAEPALVSLMSNSNNSVQSIASSYFKPLRRRKERISDLQLLLKDANPMVRQEATNALERIGVRATR
jgi:hypothetical protein